MFYCVSEALFTLVLKLIGAGENQLLELSPVYLNLRQCSVPDHTWKYRIIVTTKYGDSFLPLKLSTVSYYKLTAALVFCTGPHLELSHYCDNKERGFLSSFKIVHGILLQINCCPFHHFMLNLPVTRAFEH